MAAHDDFILEFSRHSRSLYGFIRTLVPDRNNADDVFQATSVVMWKKFASFEPGTSFFAWGCQIARFEVRKLRDANSRKMLLSEEALDLLCAEFEARGGDSTTRLSALSGCLDKLSPTSRWLVEQRYYQERKPQDISHELGRSVASVYRALARTHKWLLGCIEETSAQEA